MKELPSRFTCGDEVCVDFGIGGQINNAMVSAVIFEQGKIFYDIEVYVDSLHCTKMHKINSSFVEQKTIAKK